MTCCPGPGPGPRRATLPGGGWATEAIVSAIRYCVEKRGGRWPEVERG